MLRYAPICAICAICAICERIESLWECAVAGAPVHAPLFAMLFCFFFAIVYSRAYAVSCAPVLGSITISVGSTSGSAGSCTPPPGWVGSPGTESRSRARSLVPLTMFYFCGFGARLEKRTVGEDQRSAGARPRVHDDESNSES
jgi:hypothetical protein